jgi:hypothetical protein
MFTMGLSTLGRRRGWLPVAVAVLVAAVAVVVLWPRDDSRLTEAAALLPDETVRVTWTDWDGVRGELGASPGTDDLDRMLQQAADLDLSAASPTAAVAGPLAETLGWGPVDAEWEILGQSPHGMVLVVKLPEDADLGRIAESYEAAGFTAPESGRTDGGLWTGGPDTVARLPGLNEPLLQYAALLEDERLLLSSDQGVSVEQAVPVVRGDEEGLDLQRLADPAGDALAAVGWATDQVCAELSMANGDSGVRAAADELVEEAGGVAPLDGYLVALRPDRALTAVLGYEDDDRAERDLESRQALAGMEDPGQALPYPELFTLSEARADGDVVVLEMEDAARDGYPLTNTTQGPVLLAAC